MPKDQYTLQIKADIADIKSKLATLEQSINQTTNKGESSFSKMGANVVVFNQALELAKRTLAGIEKVYTITVQKSIEQEEIFRRLRSTIELQGISWDSVKGKLNDYFSELQDVTKYGDTQSADMLQQLIQFSGDYEMSLKALPVALDMASSGIMKAEAAGRYLGMALQGNVEMLGRYVAELKTSTNEELKYMTNTEKVEYALKILQKRFGGMARTELKATNGKIERLNNYLGDLKEQIGDKALPAVNKITEAMTRFVASLVKDDLELTIERFRQLGVESKAIMDLQKIQLERNIIKINSELDKQGNKYNNINDAVKRAEEINNRIKEIETDRAKKKAEIERITNKLLELDKKGLEAWDEQQLLIRKRGVLYTQYREEHKKELDDLQDEAADLEMIIQLLIDRGQNAEQIKIIENEINKSLSNQAEKETKSTESQKEKQQALTKEQERQLSILRIKADINALDRERYLQYLNELLPLLDEENTAYWEIRAQIIELNQENKKREQSEKEIPDTLRYQLSLARQLSSTFGDMVYDAENLGDVLVDSAKRFTAQIAQDMFYYLIWLAITQGNNGMIQGTSPLFNLIGNGLGLNMGVSKSVVSAPVTSEPNISTASLENQLRIVNANLIDLKNAVEDSAISVKINDRDIFEANNRELQKRNRNIL